jgi:mono/diheme cytochrome c family protein
VTDIPEHLLARSRERRAALGLGGDDAGGAAATPAAGAASGEPSTTPAVRAAAAVAVPEVVEPPKPEPAYVIAAKARPKVPIFVAPVLAALPVFAFIYWGALTPKPVAEDPVFVAGKALYATNCSSCHGLAGEGGVGRPLNEVLTTFPKESDHIAWVTNGDVNVPPGTVYGGTHQAHTGAYAAAVMPAFGKTLTADEIAAVVHYERVEFGGESPTASADAGSTTTTTTK